MLQEEQHSIINVFPAWWWSWCCYKATVPVQRLLGGLWSFLFNGKVKLQFCLEFGLVVGLDAALFLKKYHKKALEKYLEVPVAMLINLATCSRSE